MNHNHITSLPTSLKRKQKWDEDRYRMVEECNKKHKILTEETNTSLLTITDELLKKCMEEKSSLDDKLSSISTQLDELIKKKRIMEIEISDIISYMSYLKKTLSKDLR